LTKYNQLAAALRNKIVTSSPINNVERGSITIIGGKYLMELVTKLNPLAANDAVASVGTAPDDGFFSPVPFVGGFGSYNWLRGWSSVDTYGMLQ
jgi:hypothetical protein